MSYYKPLNKRERSNGRAPQSTGYRQSDWQGVTMGRHAAEAPRPHDHKQFIWPYNQPPTFSGAKYWVNRHQRDFRTFAHLLELYPNLLQSEGLDPLREYMVPPENTPGHFTTSPSEFYTHSNSEPSQSSSMNTRFVYICDNTSENDFGVSSTKDKLVAALSSYCCVRTSPEQLGSYSECIDIVDVITAADAFVFLMNSRTLNSWFSLHQLGLAIAHDIPVIAVREAGFKLPPVFPPEFHHLEIVKPDSVSAAPRASPNPARSKSSEASRRTDTTAKDVNYHNDFFSDSELLKRSKRGENSPLLLSDVISGLFRTSLLYVWHLHDSCIAKLFGRLSDFLGESFLDLEISQSHSSADNSGENKLSVGNEVNQLIVGATSPFRPLPSQQNQLSALDLHLERKDATSRSSMASREHIENMSDKSRSSTASPPETVLKLPPIPKITGISPSGQSTSGSSLKSSAATSVRTSSRSSARSSVTPLPKKMSDILPDSFMDISPPSSPFIETRYIVFPSDPGGPKKPPYVVCFPDDVYTEEENRKKELDEGSDDDFQPPEEKGADFDKIRLDVSADQVISDRSPFSSPTPRQEGKKNKDKDSVKPKRLEHTNTSDSKPKTLATDRGMQKSKSKGNGSNGHQGKTKQDKDKKAMKVSRVVLKYSSDGKPLT